MGKKPHRISYKVFIQVCCNIENILLVCAEAAFISKLTEELNNVFALLWKAGPQFSYMTVSPCSHVLLRTTVLALVSVRIV